MKKQTPQHLNTSTLQHLKTFPTRLITICGSIQLISAIAAIRTKEEKEGLLSEGFENVLLIYNLNQNSPATTRLFQETLERMAKALISVKEVIYWRNEGGPPPAKNQQANKPICQALPATSHQLLANISEIWINSDFHKEIQLLCNQYDQAKIITYGDGPGIYFTKKCRFIFPQGQKQKPKITLIGSIKNLAKTLSASFVSLSLSGKKNFTPFSPLTHFNFSPTSPLKSIKFTEGYFLFPNTFEEQPEGFPYAEIKAETFAHIFKEIKPLFDFSFLEEIIGKSKSVSPTPTVPAGRPEGESQPPNGQQLQPPTPKGESQLPNDQSPNDQSPPPPLTILLTANLSEAKRIEEANELKAYENAINKQAGSNDLILIKPHPRDGQMKIKKLKRLLNQHYQNVQVIDGPGTQYIPFELFVLHLADHYYGNMENFKQMVRIITTSTACLSLAKIYGIKCKIGLEEEDIRQYFRVDRVADRLAHNRVLQNQVNDTLVYKPAVAS